MNRHRKEIIAGNEISEILDFQLGGYRQKVLIEGKFTDSPMVLFLHGGPGSPLPFNVGCRGMFPELSERFVMVYWDQLGCGINDRRLDNRLSINDYFEMTIDLVEALKKRFPQNKLILFGVSWGSILAAKTAAALPEIIDGVFVYGQVLKSLLLNCEVYDTLSATELPAKVRKKLDIIRTKEAHTIEDARNISIWVRKYTAGYNVKTSPSIPMGKFFSGFLTSPDYTLKNVFSLFINNCTKITSLMEELLDIDMSETLQKMQVPYMIFQGDHDIVTSTKSVKAFSENINNANVSVSIVENSAHMPSKAAMDILFDQLVHMSILIG